LVKYFRFYSTASNPILLGNILSANLFAVQNSYVFNNGILSPTNILNTALADSDIDSKLYPPSRTTTTLSHISINFYVIKA
jgi:hypothetical protein